MAIVLSTQGIVSGAFGTFSVGMGHGTTNYYSAAVLMKLDESGPFDLTTLMPSSGGSVAIAGSVAVTGTFWPGTQPVSGTFWQATQPVSGIFWQTTQPVSIASMPSTPVTGTFWQTTQPVSASSWPLPTGGATSALQTTGNTALTTINTTLGTPMQNTGGSVATATVSVAAVRSAALESSHVFKAAAGVVTDAYCLASSVNGFFMLFDATTAPGDGAVTPLGCVPVAAGQASSFDFPAGFPRSFATGLVGVFSTTGPFTKTASATAFMSAGVI